MDTAETNRQVVSVGEALPIEMARVRDHVMPAYRAIGQAGAFALASMRRDLDAAARALAEQDAVACVRALQELRGYET